jgi:hypothetical protein
MPPPAVLTHRALNRALLARQHLLARSSMSPLAMVEHLVALQAQNPLDPYVGLWSRLSSFEPAELAAAIESRQAVRLGLLRTTLHLVSARDALAVWPLTAPVLERAWQSSPFRRQLDGIDVEAVKEEARRRLEADGPLTAAALGRALGETWPSADRISLSYVARFLLPVVQVPPRGLWGRTGQATWTTLEAWLGRPLAGSGTLDALVLRYLAAFGPASPADVRTWSWLTGAAEIVERLRPQLVTFRDEAGRELFDLPAAPRPDPDTPAPPRFLPEFDNALLSHDDRRRVIPEAYFGRLTGWVGSFLVDGFLAGQWRVDRAGAGRGAATLVLQPFDPLATADEAALVEEAMRLVAWHAPDAPERRVEFGIAREAPADGRPGIGGTRRVVGR